MCVRTTGSELQTSFLKNRKQRKLSLQVTPSLVKTMSKDEKIRLDLLAVATIKQREFLDVLYDFLSKCQETRTYRVIFKMTQPAHVITALAVFVIATLLYPGTPGRKSYPLDVVRITPVLSMIYLFTFMMHFGAQMWMTFVSGLSLYFSIPRHTFGEVQKVLFPKYFSVNSFLGLVTLVIFVKMHPSSTWDSYIGIQVGAMVLCFLLELVIRLYLAPPLVQLTIAKNAMEASAGVGMEVGKYDPGPLAKCPHYVKIHRTFRKVHMTIAIGNIIAMACTTLHLHYLSHKVSVV